MWRSQPHIKWRPACANTRAPPPPSPMRTSSRLPQRYLQRVEAGLHSSGIDAPLNIMLSSGGTTTVAASRDFPVRLVESGPAGGALAGVHWGRLLGQADVLAFDMGGTTAKAALTRAGELADQQSVGGGACASLQARQRLALDGAHDRDDRNRRWRRQHRPS